MTSPVIFDPAKHEYRNAQGNVVWSVTQILASAGICDFSYVEEERRIAAMTRGTSVHWLLQLEDEGALNYRQVPLRLKPYRKGYMSWKAASGFLPDRNWIEKQFISHYGYAGTVDRFGMFPPTPLYPKGTVGVIDFKTGEIPDWVRLQLVAYAMRTHVNPAIARRTRRIGLALRANGTYAVREFSEASWDTDWARFMKAKKETDVGHVEHLRAGN